MQFSSPSATSLQWANEMDDLAFAEASPKAGGFGRAVSCFCFFLTNNMLVLGGFLLVL